MIIYCARCGSKMTYSVPDNKYICPKCGYEIDNNG